MRTVPGEYYENSPRGVLRLNVAGGKDAAEELRYQRASGTGRLRSPDYFSASYIFFFACFRAKVESEIGKTSTS